MLKHPTYSLASLTLYVSLPYVSRKILFVGNLRDACLYKVKWGGYRTRGVFENVTPGRTDRQRCLIYRRAS